MTSTFAETYDINECGANVNLACMRRDRIFKFYYAAHPHNTLDNCVWTDYSAYDQEVLLPDAFASLTWGKKKQSSAFIIISFMIGFHLILIILFLHRN